MENEEIIKRIKKYLRKNKTVDIKWFINDLGLQKNAREIDVINQGVINGIWFKNYNGHNPNDISIKYSRTAQIGFFINMAGGIIGLAGGLLGIISFFR
jgi:hypothetical protein